MPNPLTKEAPYKGPSADSEEKHEPASDIDTALMDSLKVLDPEGPIREADIVCRPDHVRKVRIVLKNSVLKPTVIADSFRPIGAGDRIDDGSAAG